MIDPKRFAEIKDDIVGDMKDAANNVAFLLDVIINQEREIKRLRVGRKPYCGDPAPQGPRSWLCKRLKGHTGMCSYRSAKR